jgi:hypothetical protein
VYRYIAVHEDDFKGDKARPRTELACIGLLSFFKAYKRALAIKFGRPTLDDKDENEMMVMWVFPSTIITLEYFNLELDKLFCNTTIEYVPNNEN